MQGHPVLDRPARVHELGLHQHGGVVRADQLVQLDEGGLPDGLKDVFSEVHSGCTYTTNKPLSTRFARTAFVGRGDRAIWPLLMIAKVRSVPAAQTSNPQLQAWVDETARLTQPDRVVWCDGSPEEKKLLTEEAVASG